ncbi:hypothetical protein ABK040_014513 [Willaertia magna]
MSQNASLSGSSGIVNTDNTFIRCYTSKWQQTTLPNNKKIRSITCTASETIILTESNELFLFGDSLYYGEYLKKITDKLCQFNFIGFVNNYLKMDYVPKIKEIFGTFKIIILQLENNEFILFAFNGNKSHGLYIKDNLKMFATCPLSSRFIAINKSNEIKSLQFDYVNGIKEKTELRF